MGNKYQPELQKYATKNKHKNNLILVKWQACVFVSHEFLNSGWKKMFRISCKKKNPRYLKLLQIWIPRHVDSVVRSGRASLQ